MGFKRKLLTRKDRMLLLSKAFLHIKSYIRHLELLIKRFEANADRLRKKAQKSFVMGDKGLAKEYLEEANYALNLVRNLRQIQLRFEKLSLKMETMLKVGMLTSHLLEVRRILEDLDSYNMNAFPELGMMIDNLKHDIALITGGLGIDNINDVMDRDIKVQSKENKYIEKILEQADREAKKRIANA